jgi:hypothetical protein
MVSVIVSLSQADLDLLASEAELGRMPWVTVAIHERAVLGIVHYRTWIQLQDDERVLVGRMNQSTARRKLQML